MIKIIITSILSVWLLNLSSQTPNYVAFGNNISATANINCLFKDTITNTLYAGGAFEYADGKWCRGAAKWNGVAWDSMGGGFNRFVDFTPFTDKIGRILRYKNKIFYFGDFLQAGNKFTRGIGSWNGTNWDSTGYYPNGAVYDADVYNDTLYICGDFTQIGNLSTNYAAKFDGTNWYPMSFPFTTDGPILKIRAFKDKVFATGAWYANGYSLIAEYDNVQGWKPSFGVQGPTFKGVSGLERIDSLLFFYGLFTHISTCYSPDLVAWSGTKLYSFGLPSDPYHNNSNIKKIKKINNKIYTLGVFDNIGGMYPTLGVNQLIGIGELSFDSNFNAQWCISSEYFDNQTSDVEIYNNDIIISGSFFKINNDSIKKCAKWLGGSFSYSCNTYYVGLEQQNKLESFYVFPNPTTSILNISDEQNQLQNATIEIKNYLGQIVFTSPFTSQIDLQNLSAGMYFLTIQDRERKQTIKIVKE